jgi:integrase
MPRSKTTKITSKKAPKTPKLRLHKPSGLGFVVLNGGKPIYLGKYELDATQEAYHRVIAEWKANGCKPPAAPSDITVVELLDRFWSHAKDYYRDSKKRKTTSIDNFRSALRPVVGLYGSTAVVDFGPIALKAVRQVMIDLGWSRTYINEQVRRIKQVFDWGVSEELYPASVADALKYVKGLRKGRSPARETKPVKPAPNHLIDAIKPHVDRRIWAMVQIMRISGPRPDEVVRLRPIDLDMTGEVWVAQLEKHKTEYMTDDYTDSDRLILLGPQVQELIRPFLADRPVDAYLFSPREAESERRAEMHRNRKTPLSCGNKPGTNKSKNPKRPPGDQYRVDTLLGAMKDGSEKAFPPPAELQRQRVPGKRKNSTRWETRKEHQERLGQDGWAALLEWNAAHSFTSRQLRHNAATELRKKYGLDVTQTVLGHAMGSKVTAMVYAEAALDKAMDAMAEVG